MSISKTSKSVVKYQSSSRHDGRYSRPRKSYNCYQTQPRKPPILPKNIKQSFWEEEQRVVLSKEILRVRLSNLDMKDLSLKVGKFKVGNIKNYYNMCAKITSDHFILDIVKKGLKVSLNKLVVGNAPHLCHRKQEEVLAINLEVEKLLKKRIIVREPQDGKGYFSNIFVHPKKDGSHGMILNLKKLNTSVEAPHFKIESITNITSMIHKNSWMVSVDLKDRYVTIPTHSDHQALLRFLWYDTYQFTAMSNGYSDAMRVFTKILKLPFTLLRKFGHFSAVYVDDTYLQGENLFECMHNLEDTVALFQALGFIIHHEKSQLIPTQKTTFLGFVIDSTKMAPKFKKQKTKKQNIYSL